jgi:flagellar biosynthetic protein FliP
MLVLGSALLGLAALVGVSRSELTDDAPALLLIGMGLSMTAPMVWWMARRGHSAAATREMAGAMIVPTVAVVALLAFGTVTDVGELLEIQHVVMFPAMLAVMLLRRSEYSGH